MTSLKVSWYYTCLLFIFKIIPDSSNYLKASAMISLIDNRLLIMIEKLILNFFKKYEMTFILFIISSIFFYWISHIRHKNRTNLLFPIDDNSLLLLPNQTSENITRQEQKNKELNARTKPSLLSPIDNSPLLFLPTHSSKNITKI